MGHEPLGVGDRIQAGAAMTKSRNINKPKITWTRKQEAIVRSRYPHERTENIATTLGMNIDQIYKKAHALGLKKTDEYLASPDACRLRRGDNVGALSNKENPMQLDRAKAINETAQTIINSVKAEYDALKVIGGTGSGFIPTLPPVKPEPRPALENLRSKGILPDDGGTTHPSPGHTVHKLRG